jgi:hypothetical protein
MTYPKIRKIAEEGRASAAVGTSPTLVLDSDRNNVPYLFVNRSDLPMVLSRGNSAVDFWTDGIPLEPHGVYRMGWSDYFGGKVYAVAPVDGLELDIVEGVHDLVSLGALYPRAPQPISRQNTGDDVGDPGAIIASGADLELPSNWTGGSQDGHVFSLLQRGDGDKRSTSYGELGKRPAAPEYIDVIVDASHTAENSPVLVGNLAVYEPDHDQVAQTLPIEWQKARAVGFGEMQTLGPIVAAGEFAAPIFTNLDADTTVRFYAFPRRPR